MSYSLFTDKPNKFNCNIEIEGTSLSKSKVRLVIETNEMSYMFNGKIENTGICEVNIPKTKHFLPEGTIGNMRLEVIADDVYFEPWSSDFNVRTNKKVNVVVSEQHIDEKPQLKVEVIQPETEKVVTETKKPLQQKPEIKKESISKEKTFTVTKEQFIRLFQKGKI